jgi:hypothetical protein
MQPALGVVSMCFALSPVRPATATLGGPDLSSVLGYERESGRLYYEVTSYSEGPETLIYSVAPDSLGLVPPTCLPPPRFDPRDFGAAERWTRATIDSLSGALAHLDTLPRARVQLTSEVLTVGTFRGSSEDASRTEFLVSVHVAVLALSGQTVLATFCRPDVRVAEVYVLSGGATAVTRIAYTGVPWETCYDADVLVPLRLQRGGAK